MFYPVFLCILSGALYWAAFPPADLGFAAWFALIPFFFACKGRKNSHKLILGFIAGTTAFSLNLYWLYPTIRVTGESAPVSFAGVILAGAFLAIFAALWALFCEENSLYAAATGVILSWLGGRILWSVPWCPLYVSQAAYPIMLQICSIAGPYFLTFLIIYANHSFYRAIALGKLRPLIPAVGLIALTLIFGAYKISRPLSGKEYDICAVQPNVSQDIKWDSAQTEAVKDKIRLFTAASGNADLTVFPEAVLPGVINYDADMRGFISELERMKKKPGVLGAAFYGLEEEKDGNYRRVLKNSALLLNPYPEAGAETASRQFYFKRRLVPFGEFVPFSEFLGRFINVINELGGFEAGKEAVILRSGNFRIITLICSESVYPYLWRGDGNIVVNITNDAWFGKTAAAEQHLRHVMAGAAAFGLPAVFANNTGPSALIDSRGRIIRQSEAFEACSFTDKVMVPERGSFYGMHWDITLLFSFGTAAYAIFMIFKRRFKWIKIC